MVRVSKKGLVIVDVQPGFMPASEGERLGLPGYGELGVDGAEKIIPNINLLTRVFHSCMYLIATTQDNHPEETAHFSPNPDFVKTWPVHCVAGTPGAELHPDLLVAQHPAWAKQFIKGDKACETPEEDDSYTGALAHEPDSDFKLPEWLTSRKVEEAYFVGVAVGDCDENPLCVDSTTIDHHNLGFRATFVEDAVAFIDKTKQELCVERLRAMGIRVMTTAEVLEEIGYEQ